MNPHRIDANAIESPALRSSALEHVLVNNSNAPGEQEVVETGRVQGAGGCEGFGTLALSKGLENLWCGGLPGVSMT